jgi:mRNA (guanine-N7-)-methyltransferase
MTWNASDHYDARARPGVSARVAIAERAAGPSADIKRYHNDVKRRLIDVFSTGAARYLDIACGRGGDIHKWVRAGVEFVRGIDISAGEIEEARSRFAAVRPRPRKTTCVFDVVTQEVANWNLENKKKYDVVACMFAIHYFFSSEDVARSLFETVAAALEDGGVFFGTFPDGHKILEARSNSMMTVDAPFERAAAEPFGSAYTFSIVDTVVDRDGSREFLVFPETLISLALDAGLEPVIEYDTGTLLDSSDRRKCIRHFSSRLSDPDARAVSAVYATFAFRKTPQNSRMSRA